MKVEKRGGRKAYQSDSAVEKAGGHHRGCTIGRNRGCSSYVAVAVDVAVVASQCRSRVRAAGTVDGV
jgi:hypothetical protein